MLRRFCLLMAVMLVAGCNRGGTGEGGPTAGRKDINDFILSTKEEKWAIEESWKKFLAGVKSTEIVAAAKNHWEKGPPVRGTLDIIFDKDEMRLQPPPFPEHLMAGVQENRVYDIGVVHLTAREDSGSGVQTRHYELHFLSKGVGAPWEFLQGTYTTDGDREIKTLYPHEYEGYLKVLFSVQAKKAGPAAPVRPAGN